MAMIALKQVGERRPPQSKPHDVPRDGAGCGMESEHMSFVEFRAEADMEPRISSLPQRSVAMCTGSAHPTFADTPDRELR
jgi:hypothetical protein